MDYLRLLRPHQWVKNMFVLLPALVAGGVGHLPWGGLLMCLAAFCLASSAVYVANDIIDADRDRQHPTKKARPIAAGLVSETEGWAIAAGLLIGAGLLATFAANATLGFIAAYVALNMVYSVWTKHVPILDGGSIALGFCIRFLAGGVGFGIPINPFLLCVCFFGAFAMAMLKRRIELSLVPDGSAASRPSLQGLNLQVLDLLIGIFGATAMALYAQWSVSSPKPLTIFTLPLLAFSMSRVLWLAYLNKKGEDFSKTLITDKFCLICVGLFLVAVGLAARS